MFPVNDEETQWSSLRHEPAVAVLLCAEKQQFNSIQEIVLLHWWPSNFCKSCRVATIRSRPSWELFGLNILCGAAFWLLLNSLLPHFEKATSLKILPARSLSGFDGYSFMPFDWDHKPRSGEQASFFSHLIVCKLLRWKKSESVPIFWHEKCRRLGSILMRSLLILPRFVQTQLPLSNFPVY